MSSKALALRREEREGWRRERWIEKGSLDKKARFPLQRKETLASLSLYSFSGRRVIIVVQLVNIAAADSQLELGETRLEVVNKQGPFQGCNCIRIFALDLRAEISGIGFSPALHAVEVWTRERGFEVDFPTLKFDLLLLPLHACVLASLSSPLLLCFLPRNTLLSCRFDTGDSRIYVWLALCCSILCLESS